MNDDHVCSVDCSERMCYKSSDHNLCDRHYEEKMEASREAGRDAASDAVDKVMSNWEGVVDIDNAVSIAGLKKELIDAINP